MLIHWSWFLVAYFQINNPVLAYSSLSWNVAEYLLIFGVVLLHEFGHVLACRQVGGFAGQVVLWPLGGLALVNAPPRPGPFLWTIVAGPLVNLALVPVSFILFLLVRLTEFGQQWPDLDQLLLAFTAFNIGLLVFNLLPIFPLDGGQILQALLWFKLGRPRSLMIASSIGMAVSAVLAGFAFLGQEWWLLIITLFLLLASMGGFTRARLLARMEEGPRHLDLCCPTCGSHPPLGAFWRCNACFQLVDLFANDVSCPRGTVHRVDSSCLDCGRSFPPTDWVPVAPPPAIQIEEQP